MSTDIDKRAHAAFETWRKTNLPKWSPDSWRTAIVERAFVDAWKLRSIESHHHEEVFDRAVEFVTEAQEGASRQFHIKELPLHDAVDRYKEWASDQAWLSKVSS